MWKIALLVVVFATVITFTSNCSAMPVPYISFQDLLSKSDFICKGEILQVDKIGESEERAIDGRLLRKIDTKVALVGIDRILKGNETEKTINVEFEEVSLTNVFLPRMTLKKGEYVLLFLKREGGRYKLTFKYYGNFRAKIPVSKSNMEIEAEGSNPSALVQQELFNSLKIKDPNVILPLLEALGEIKSKAAIMHIENLLDSNDVAVKGLALSTLIKIGSIDHIAEAISYIDEQQVAKAQGLKARIIYVLETIRDPNAVPELHALLKHQNPLVRREVARGLRQIKSQSSIPFFVDGLDDSNVNVRYQCMMGLAEMIGKGKGWKVGNWGPSYRLFLQGQSKYILFWKNWWEEKGKARFGDIPAPPAP